MELSKLSKALTPINLADTTIITISPSFKLRVCQMVNYNQVYNKKIAELGKKFPTHQFNRDFKAFIQDWYGTKQTPDTVSFMAHVILCGWELQDDDGNDVEFTPQNAIELLQTRLGHTLFGKIANAVQNDSLFNMEWTEDAVKNS